MKEPSIIFKSAAEGADQIGGAAPKPPVWGEQQTNLNAIVFSKSHPIHPFFSDFFLLNLTHTTDRPELPRQAGAACSRSGLITSLDHTNLQRLAEMSRTRFFHRIWVMAYMQTLTFGLCACTDECLSTRARL